jgi:flagellar assembly protein FliH
VAPDFVEATRAELTAIAQIRGFAGRLIVLGDPEVAEGDARLEWADGGVVRDAAAVERAIRSALARHLGPGDATASDEGTTP